MTLAEEDIKIMAEGDTKEKKSTVAERDHGRRGSSHVLWRAIGVVCRAIGKVGRAIGVA